MCEFFCNSHFAEKVEVETQKLLEKQKAETEAQRLLQQQQAEMKLSFPLPLVTIVTAVPFPPFANQAAFEFPLPHFQKNLSCKKNDHSVYVTHYLI